jgi:sucrose-6-phosphate hydrolase SacC (GH32 family)
LPQQNCAAADPNRGWQVVVFGTMQCTAGRCLHVGWFNVGAGCLTSPRELTLDSSSVPSDPRVVALPVAELAALRTTCLGTRDATPVTPSAPVAAFDAGALSTTFDLDATLLVPNAAANQTIDMAVLAASPTQAEVLISIDIEPDAAPTGAVLLRVNVSVPFATSATYNTTLAVTVAAVHALDGGGWALPLRIVADRTIVEVFLGGGRAVVSTPVLSPGLHPTYGGVFFGAPGASAYAVTSKAWAMGCGWARYP